VSPRPSPHAAGPIRGSASANGDGKANKGSTDGDFYGRRNPNATGTARRMLSDAANRWRLAHPKAVRMTDVREHEAAQSEPADVVEVTYRDQF